MKKIFTLLSAVCFSAAVQAQVVAPSEITSNTIWTSNNVYELNGYVYVKNGATLTIEPGTLIKGDRANKGTLIITRGSKLMAVGTKTRPIVFTSKEDPGDRSPGDWGGVVLLGRAPINPPGGETQAEGGINNAAGDGLYGGTDSEDNSGHLSFVRIEFPGIPLSQEANSEINGLTMGGVGRGTIIDHIQVSYSGDDSYEWFGGNVNARYLISVRGQDDEFDTDFGFTGKVQFGLSMRNPSLADQSGSNGFESDNDGGQGSTNTPITAPVFSNMTLIGPKSISPTFDANFKRALHLRRNTKTSVFNSVFTGYPLGLRLDGANTLANVNSEELKFRNNIIADCATPFDTVNMGPSAGFDIASWFNTSGWGNENLATTAAVGYTNVSNLDNPDFTASAGAPVLSGASFSDSKLQDAFFVPVTFRGAIGDVNWTECWANFNPNATEYTSGPIITGATADFNFTQQEWAYTVEFTNASTDATSYVWNFGDGETSTDATPWHTFSGPGTYSVSLTASRTNGCDSVITKDVTVILVGIEDVANAYGVSVRPNPANEIAVLDFNLKTASETTVEILDITGKTVQVVLNSKLQSGKQTIALNTSELSAGLYIIKIQSGGAAQTLRLAIGK
jgi:hypothetical protein